MKPAPTYGPKPWLQMSWDARAAFNFMFGGAGSGLAVTAAFFVAPASGWRALLALALVLVAMGLGSVWLELGRPWRFMNVAFNPRTSWMTREAYASGVVFAFGAAAIVTGLPWLAWVAALAAFVFVYCQSRMLRAAKGIPAWRVPSLSAFVVATAMAEGAGLAVALAPLALGAVPRWAVAFLLAAVLVRLAMWWRYSASLKGRLAPQAAGALAAAGTHVVVLGSIVPAFAIVVALALPVVAAVALTIGGLAALAAGWHTKFVIVRRAAYNQGFALPVLPVRGVR
jgi:phenylacetyl-CoA:acceptor oxidoreductase 26-kDa subunit